LRRPFDPEPGPASLDPAGRADRNFAQPRPVRLVVYPDAYFAFDFPVLKSPTWYRGRDVEFSKSAADQTSEALRDFFQTTFEGK
jgi:hypothetical protein